MSLPALELISEKLSNDSLGICTFRFQMAGRKYNYSLVLATTLSVALTDIRGYIGLLVIALLDLCYKSLQSHNYLQCHVRSKRYMIQILIRKTIMIMCMYTVNIYKVPTL